MEAVIVDLESTRGTESPYVMISRAKSLDGIFILRPFRHNKIQCHPSQDVRNEFKRLDILCHQTIMQFGSPTEASESQEYLVKTFSAAALPQDGDQELVPITPDARRLATLQSTTARLISGVAPTSPSTGCGRPRNTKQPRRPQPSVAMEIDSDAVTTTRKRPHPDLDDPDATVPARTANCKRTKRT